MTLQTIAIVNEALAIKPHNPRVSLAQKHLRQTMKRESKFSKLRYNLIIRKLANEVRLVASF